MIIRSTREAYRYSKQKQQLVVMGACDLESAVIHLKKAGSQTTVITGKLFQRRHFLQLNRPRRITKRPNSKRFEVGTVCCSKGPHRSNTKPILAASVYYPNRTNLVNKISFHSRARVSAFALYPLSPSLALCLSFPSISLSSLNGQARCIPNSV